MSCVLYYSNYCQHSKQLIQKLSKSKLKQDVHYINIDNRVTENNSIYIVLQNGTKILLPPNVQRVPCLLLLNRGHNVIVGEEIEEYLIQKEARTVQQMQGASGAGGGSGPLGEPCAFGMSDFGNIHSDNYSFLDQGENEMSAKGNGGMRQIYNYATIDTKDLIETPPDNYVPDKVKEGSLQQLQAQRAADIPKPHMRV